MGHGTINQKQLAKSLGLSQQAVSYALRGQAGVGSETRQRVLDAAAKHGYRPHAGAKAMRRGQFNAVGLVSGTDASNGRLPSGTLYAIERRLGEADLQLVLTQMSDEILASSERLPRLVREWSVDGLLISYAADWPEQMEWSVEATRLPWVWINVKRAHNAVRPADFEASRDATRHLLELGHRRVMYLTPDAEHTHYSVADRRAGYEAAMAQAGLTPHVAEVPREMHRGAAWPSPSSPAKHAYAWARRVLAEPDRPTAVLSYASTHGGAWVDAALFHGLDVPGAFSFVGFGDNPSTDRIEIGTLGVPTFAMGYHAVDMLRERLSNGGDPLPTRSLPFCYSPGDTVGRLKTTHS
jgi:LacI family transcriptional regulator